MMRVLVLCLLVVAPVSAQTLRMDVDKRPLFGEFTQFAPAELDGNPATREWLSYDIAGLWRNWFRVIILRNGEPCRGPRFNPWSAPPSIFNAAQAYLSRGPEGLDFLVVQTSSSYREYTLEVPVQCQPF